MDAGVSLCAGIAGSAFIAAGFGLLTLRSVVCCEVGIPFEQAVIAMHRSKSFMLAMHCTARAARSRAQLARTRSSSRIAAVR